MNPLILFDFDGVLADSFDLFSAAFLESCRAHGVQAIFSPKEFLDLFDGNLYEELARRGINGSLQTALFQCMAQTLAQRSTPIRLFNGIPAMLDILAPIAPLYVVTSNLRCVVTRTLAETGVTSIREIWGAETDASKARKIRWLRERHPDLRPFYVGDTAGDIREAREAGAIALAAAWGWHDRVRLLGAHPDAIVNTPAQLAAFFTQRENPHDPKTQPHAD